MVFVFISINKNENDIYSHLKKGYPCFQFYLGDSIMVSIEGTHRSSGNKDYCIFC